MNEHYRRNADEDYQSIKRRYLASNDYEELERLRAASLRQGLCLHENQNCRWERVYEGGANQFMFFQICQDCHEILQQTDEPLIQNYPSKNWAENNGPSWCRQKRRQIRCWCGFICEEDLNWHENHQLNLQKHRCQVEEPSTWRCQSQFNKSCGIYHKTEAAALRCCKRQARRGEGWWLPHKFSCNALIYGTSYPCNCGAHERARERYLDGEGLPSDSS